MTEGQPSPSGSSLKDEGNACYQEGLYLKAAALYTRALKEDPNNAVLLRCWRSPSAFTCI
jgi:tetratricopeptide (TPR) repeat protein